VFVLGSVAYWMDTTRFCSLRENSFTLEMTSQWLQRWARPIPKCAGQSYESVDTDVSCVHATDPGGGAIVAIATPKTYKSIFIHHDFVIFRKTTFVS